VAKVAPPGWLTNRRLALLIIGLIVMFVPTVFDLLNGGAWTNPESSHGPFILLVALWLMWRVWPSLPISYQYTPAPLLAWICLFLASTLYLPGRVLHLAYLDVGAFIWAMSGVVLLEGGVALFRQVAFPIVYMLFMIPLPNFLVSGISGILKHAVSFTATNVLARLGLPVAGSGVTIMVGPYELLVADACAGMSTLFMLEALGVLYLYLVHHQSRLRNIILPLLIVPISFTANVARVVILALITYYLGDEAGQGFLHGLAGIVLFLIGLSLMIAVDSALRLIGRTRLQSA
jgi:exosortase B